MPWREKYPDRWFNCEEPNATACVAPDMAETYWFVCNLLGAEIGEFATAQEAMKFVDEHPELFPYDDED